MEIQNELEKLIADDRSVFWHATLSKVIEKSVLSKEDIEELVNLLMYEKGLLNDENFRTPKVELKNLLQTNDKYSKTCLSEIKNIKNVNALSDESGLKFQESGLNIIYGDNGSGKSSYARILRHICRFRGDKPNILPNIFELEEIKGEISADICYTSNNEDISYNWIFNQTENGDLKDISIFDKNSAVRYIEDKNEVAFRPQLLTLLDDFAKGLDRIKEEIQDKIDSKNLVDFLDRFENEESEIGEFIRNISNESSIAKLNELSDFTEIDEENIQSLEKDIASLQSQDPNKEIKKLNAKVERFKKIKRRLICFKWELNEYKSEKLHEITKKTFNAEQAAQLASSTQFENESLQGVGTEVWVLLWHAARKYSEVEAYPSQEFPVINDGSRCVLCHQKLDEQSQDRLSRFDEFVKDQTQAEAESLRKNLDRGHQKIKNIGFTLEEIEDVLRELDADGLKALEEQLRKNFDLTSKRKNEISKALEVNEGWENISDLPPFPLKEFNELVKGLEKKTGELNELKKDDEIEKLRDELSQFKEKKKLNKFRDEIEEEIKKRKLIAKLEECKKETYTRLVTSVSNNLTSFLVTDELCEKFEDELVELGFSYFDLKLVKDSGVKGVTYHKLEIDDNEEVKIGQILSEGEHRCVALAHFFSELSIANNKSGIIFDDPVSSLDHRWSSNIANRIVKAAKERQVIVFTHDLTFMVRMEEFASMKSVEVSISSLDRKRKLTGISKESPPWYSQNVKQRIGSLRQLHQKLIKTEQEQTETIYKSEVSHFYGLLRETWERLVEELLLNSIVVRFGREVQTQRLKRIIDITQEDYDKIDIAMKKCSKYLSGHDEASALNDRPPSTDEIKNDIQEIDDYRVELQRKRKRQSR